jgi:hypothetical protein
MPYSAQLSTSIFKAEIKKEIEPPTANKEVETQDFHIQHLINVSRRKCTLLMTWETLP